MRKTASPFMFHEAIVDYVNDPELAKLGASFIIRSNSYDECVKKLSELAKMVSDVYAIVFYDLGFHKDWDDETGLKKHFMDVRIILLEDWFDDSAWDGRIYGQKLS